MYACINVSHVLLPHHMPMGAVHAPLDSSILLACKMPQARVRLVWLCKALFCVTCRSHPYWRPANIAEPAGVQLCPCPGQCSRSGGHLRAE